MMTSRMREAAWIILSTSEEIAQGEARSARRVIADWAVSIDCAALVPDLLQDRGEDVT
jgi:hypothetical protein